MGSLCIRFLNLTSCIGTNDFIICNDNDKLAIGLTENNDRTSNINRTLTPESRLCSVYTA